MQTQRQARQSSSVNPDVPQEADNANASETAQTAKVDKGSDNDSDFELPALITSNARLPKQPTPKRLTMPTIPPPKIPNTYKEAVEDPVYGRQWKEAVRSEILAQMGRKCFSWTVVQPDEHWVDSKWVFDVKTTPTGEIDRFKARLVARGYMQIYGLDYDDTFAPTVRKETFKLLCGVCALHHWYLHHMDVDNAFLESKYKSPSGRRLLMQPPLGFEEFLPPELKSRAHEVACEINLSLYGLKASARDWYTVLIGVLVKMGFEPTPDPALYKNWGTNVVIAFHVDDLAIAGPDLNAVKSTKQQLSEHFKMKDLGEMTQFCGIRVQQDREHGVVKLDQSLFVRQMLKDFQMQDAVPALEPSTGYEFMKKALPGDTRCDQRLYQKAVGSLQWLAGSTRLDILFETNSQGQFLIDPTVANMNGVNREMRYLKHTEDYGITYGGINTTEGGLDPSKLVSYTDADYAVDTDDRKSRFGTCWVFNGGVIAAESQKQSTVVSSTTEAETIASCEGGKQSTFLYRVLYTLLPGDYLPITICQDNQGAIALAKNPEFHKRTKHIDTRYFYIRQLVEDHQIAIYYVPTQQMVADIFTKPLKAFNRTYALYMLGIGPV